MLKNLKNFYYQHQIYASLRQATGALLPAVLIGGWLNQYAIGVMMTVGAFCLAMIDQYGGNRKTRLAEFFIASGLCTLVALVSGLSSGYLPLLLLTVAVICFCCAMLNVFGPRWGLVALSGLFVMILNVRTPTHGSVIWWNALYTLLGTQLYLIYTIILRYFVYLNEERRAVYNALKNTSAYVQKRAALYDINADLNRAYSDMFNTRANMTSQFQTATNVLLSDFPRRRPRDQGEHLRLQTLLINAMSIADILIATQTDYSELRDHLGHSRFIMLCKNTLQALAHNLGTLAENAMHRHKQVSIELPAADLKAITEELKRYRREGLYERDPAIHALMILITRRIRKVYFAVQHTANNEPLEQQTVSLQEFVQDSPSSGVAPQQPFSWKLLGSNLNLKSPTCRYALRLALAGLTGLLVPLALGHLFSEKLLYSAFTQRSYWVLLTLVLVMKPGFALTRERNKRRLAGTLIGCAIAFVLFKLHPDGAFLFILMWLLYALALCYLPINYFYGATFVTVFIMIAFYFLHEAGTFVIEERLVDTAVGCTLALLLSHVLPNWESASINNFARAALNSQLELLRLGQQWSNDSQHQTQWKTANNHAEISLSNFSAAFQRMLSEPAAHQQHTAAYNRLLVQLFVMNSQLSLITQGLSNSEQVPDAMQPYFAAAIHHLQGAKDDTPLPSLADHAELTSMASPLAQLMRASVLVKSSLDEIQSAPTLAKQSLAAY